MSVFGSNNFKVAVKLYDPSSADGHEEMLLLEVTAGFIYLTYGLSSEIYHPVLYSVLFRYFNLILLIGEPLLGIVRPILYVSPSSLFVTPVPPFDIILLFPPIKLVFRYS